MAFTTWRRVVTPPARRDVPSRCRPSHMAIPEDGPLAAVPPGLSFRDVAPGTEGAHYALSIIRKARLSAGQDVLANGATGVFGSAVQLLADLCARVTAVLRRGGVGAGAWRRPGHRPGHGGLHQGRPSLRRRLRRSRQELLPTVPPGAQAPQPVPDDRAPVLPPPATRCSRVSAKRSSGGGTGHLARACGSSPAREERCGTSGRGSQAHRSTGRLARSPA